MNLKGTNELEVAVPKRDQLIAMFPVYCKVFPLERPRKGKQGHIYQPKEKQQELMIELGRFDKLNIDYPVIIDTYIFFGRPLNSKEVYPTAKHYGDEDNLRKAINDCLVDKEIIRDDKLVVGGENFKQFNTDDHAIIKIYSIERGVND